MVPNKKECRAIHILSVGKDLASLLKLEWLTFVVNGIIHYCRIAVCFVD